MDWLNNLHRITSQKSEDLIIVGLQKMKEFLMYTQQQELTYLWKEVLTFFACFKRWIMFHDIGHEIQKANKSIIFHSIVPSFKVFSSQDVVC